MTPFDPDRHDPDRQAREELARHRRFATALLVLMAGLTLYSYSLPPGYWAELLQASAKAGFVGGIADWFAVTALFRHPLGLPIPHTAIIPNQKERLGQGLGRFVANHVFTEDEVRRVTELLAPHGEVVLVHAPPEGTGTHRASWLVPAALQRGGLVTEVQHHGGLVCITARRGSAA